MAAHWVVMGGMRIKTVDVPLVPAAIPPVFAYEAGLVGPNSKYHLAEVEGVCVCVNECLDEINSLRWSGSLDECNKVSLSIGYE